MVRLHLLMRAIIAYFNWKGSYNWALISQVEKRIIAYFNPKNKDSLNYKQKS